MTSCVATSNGFNITQAASDADRLDDLGANDYLVVMYCPALSHLACANVPPFPASMRGKQPSGLAMLQTNSEVLGLDLGMFFGVRNGLPSPTTLSVNTTATMEGLYGYQSTADVETFVYSGELEFRFVIPQANLTGTLYKGTARLGQFFNSVTLGTNNTFQLSQLIRMADHVESMQSGFVLSSAMVNDYILTHTLRSGSDVITTGVLTDELLGSELVHYAVIQKPAINVTTGENSTYSLI